jgi:hypothetical protein
MKRFMQIALLAAFLSGCAAAPPLSAEQKRALEPPVCMGVDQCTVMWQKAQLWIVKRSAWKIQTSNDTLIQTFGPADSMDMAYIVTKEPAAQGAYSIHLHAECGNFIGCNGTPAGLTVEFNDYIRPQPAAIQHRITLGIQFSPLSADDLSKLPTRATYASRVLTVAPGGIGERSGLRVGDVIVLVDGTPIATDSDLGNAAQNWSKQKPGRLGIVREGLQMDLVVTIGAL